TLPTHLHLVTVCDVVATDVTRAIAGHRGMIAELGRRHVRSAKERHGTANRTHGAAGSTASNHRRSAWTRLDSRVPGGTGPSRRDRVRSPHAHAGGRGTS